MPPVGNPRRNASTLSVVTAEPDVPRLDDAFEGEPWLTVPGYEVCDSPEKFGVFIKSIQSDKAIATAPINVCATGIDEQGTHYLTLRWRHGTTEHRITRPRAEVAGAKLSALSAIGAPVTASTCGPLQVFLQKLEQYHHAGLPKVRIYTRQGWGPGNETFVIGSRIIGATGTHPQGAIVGSHADSTSALAPKGDLDAYLEILRDVIPHSLATEMAWAAGYVGPLLRLLNERSWLLSLWGPAGRGKTAVQALALSPWGNPGKLMLTGNTTLVALEAHLARCRDGIAIIDDTQQTSSKIVLSNLAYQISGGMGKGRGTMTGAAQPLQSWLSLGFVSGERPLIQPGAPAGSRNRTLEINSAPMANSALAQELHVGLSRHHGITGELFVRALIDHVVVPGRESWLQSQCQDVFRRLAAQCADICRRQGADTCQRLGHDEQARHVAHLVLADMLARQWVLDEEPTAAQSAASRMGAAVMDRVRKTY